MAHPIIHAKSNVKKFGGKWEDYIHLHEWMDSTKSWVCRSIHRMFRHHAEGIFDGEKIFGSHFTNSDGKVVYTRYCLEQQVKVYLNVKRFLVLTLQTLTVRLFIQDMLVSSM